MGQAKQRKAEIDALKDASPKVDPKAFIKQCKAVAAKYEWTDGYTTFRPMQKLKAELLALIASSGISATSIQNAYPNYGTYTYTDGIVDYVLGLMSPLSSLIDSLPAGTVVAVG